jgi:hypothetical protein
MYLQDKKFKLPFNNCNKLLNNYSQAGQDLFVLSCLNGKENGTFLDFGCYHPIDINNTYLLEKEFSWSGLSFDINQQMIDEFHVRSSKAYAVNCLEIQFDNLIKDANTNKFDYLSLDLEPALTTLDCLKTIPFDKLEFSIITFEHDFYRFGDFCRDQSRKLLQQAGYKLICSNVKNVNNIFEDWYYNPKYVNYEDIKILESYDKEWSDIVFK